MVLTLEIRIIAGNQAHLRVGEITRGLVRFFVAGLALAAAAHSQQAGGCNHGKEVRIGSRSANERSSRSIVRLAKGVFVQEEIG